MAGKPTKPDWRRRWYKRRLDAEELVDVVLDFVAEAVLAEEALRASAMLAPTDWRAHFTLLVRSSDA